MTTSTLADQVQVTMMQEPSLNLPKTRRLWKDAEPFWKYWEDLRPFFASHGFTLYQRDLKNDKNLVLHRKESISSLERPFGLFGDVSGRSGEYDDSNTVAYPAQDESGRDVVIKAIHGVEGKLELEILRFLNSEPRRTDQDNPTIPVLCFLQYGDWHFVVTPMWTSCYGNSSLHNVAECLEFGNQLLRGISYLHSWGIAHQDIAFENIMINTRGKEPLNFRSSHDVRYSLIDFGNSFMFRERDLASVMVKPFNNNREQRSPEVGSGDACNPFASDVYMAGRFLYAWFNTILQDVQGLLELLQDMTELEPALRPSASEVADQFSNLCPKAVDNRIYDYKDEIDIDMVYPPVPRRQFRIELPKSLSEWADLSLDEFSRTWESLRPFFAEHGLILFDLDENGECLTFTRGEPSPSSHLSRLAGDRSELVTRLPIVSRRVYAARSHDQQDVLIRLISHGDDGAEEMEILQRLAEPDVYCQFGIPCSKLKNYGNYCFGAWLMWQDCATPPPISIEESFAVIEQAIEKLRLLHEDKIVHLDLHPTKFRMPIYGKAALDFRTSLKATYLYTGFTKGYRFPASSEPQSRLLPPRLSRRLNRAPEMDGKSVFDPFAADVYMLARMLYALFKPIVPDVPGLLTLLQDMSRFEPTDRVSLAAALERFRDVQQNVSKEQLAMQRFDIVYDETFPSIPSDVEHIPTLSSSDIEGSCTAISNASDTMSSPGDTSLTDSDTSAITSIRSGDEETSGDKISPAREAESGGLTLTNGLPKSVEPWSDTVATAESLKFDDLTPAVVPPSAIEAGRTPANSSASSYSSWFYFVLSGVAGYVSRLLT